MKAFRCSLRIYQLVHKIVFAEEIDRDRRRSPLEQPSEGIVKLMRVVSCSHINWNFIASHRHTNVILFVYFIHLIVHTLANILIWIETFDDSGETWYLVFAFSNSIHLLLMVDASLFGWPFSSSACSVAGIVTHDFCLINGIHFDRIVAIFMRCSIYSSQLLRSVNLYLPPARLNTITESTDTRAYSMVVNFENSQHLIHYYFTHTHTQSTICRNVWIVVESRKDLINRIIITINNNIMIDINKVDISVPKVKTILMNRYMHLYVHCTACICVLNWKGKKYNRNITEIFCTYKCWIYFCKQYIRTVKRN